MLRVLGSAKKLCDGLTRRDLLQVGGLGTLGLGLPQLLSQQTAVADETIPGFGKAKHCILLFLYGSPSQLETFDMKPDAPAEIRGEMKPISSSVPGLSVCEHLPETAKIMDKASIVRSMVHPYPVHGVAYAMTGVEKIDVAAELDPQDPRHHPWFGSVVEYLDRNATTKTNENSKRALLQNVALPFPFSSQRTDQPFRAGPYGAFLGNTYNPLWTQFVGEGTKEITKSRTGFSFTGKEPYLGCTDDTHFRIATGKANAQLTLDRMNRRQSLLEQFNSTRKDLDRSSSGKNLSEFQQMAFSLLTSPEVADALDTRKEKQALREMYGMTLFGQSCLTARRLVEAGTKLVSVFWDEYGLAGDAWDTHANHYPRMKEQLLPGLDKALFGLLTDLDDRGMLDETLVVCISEHGRTPKLNRSASRDHWSRAYSAFFAGGGMARGNVVGASDKHASDVADYPVSPKDIQATLYHLLGIKPHTTIPNLQNRPVTLVPHDARIVEALL